MIETPIDQRNIPLTYLALGDSYTIGESVSQEESFPYQLIGKLRSLGFNFAEPPKIIAKTGWTADELQAGIKAENLNQNYTIVTLLIGVNNQYRSYSINIYKKEFSELLQTAIDYAGKNKKLVFVISIPDYGVTPFGIMSNKDEEIISEEIDAFNAVNKDEALAMGISYTDITPTSRNVKTDTTLITGDGLHPSGKMYREWVNVLIPKITSALK